MVARASGLCSRGQGARRVWSDSKGAIWVAEWNSGNLSRYEPKSNKWSAWKAPTEGAQVYAVYVDDEDKVWLTDWGANALVKFDPATEKFEAFPFPHETANVRQIHGRPGQVLVAESGPRIVSIFRR